MIDWRFIVSFGILWLVGCNPIDLPQPTPVLSTPTLPATTTPTRDIRTSTPTPDIYATELAITSTAIVEAIVATQQPRVYGTYSSPDGEWRAEVVIYDCIKVDAGVEAGENALEQLLLTNVSSGDENLIDAQLQNCGGLGAAGFEGLFWSHNSRYFYYTDSRAGVPDGCGGYWQRPYLRLEINTLDVEDLGGGVRSPDGSKLATWQGQELVIWDVNEGDEVGRISPYVVNTDTGTGALVWSPDSQALIYVQPESYCPVSGNSAIVHVDLATLEQTILVESEAPTFGGATWDNAEELALVDENGNRWVYAFGTRELEPLP